MSKRKNLTWTQRLIIDKLNKASVSKKEMARILGLALSTIYKELARGQCKQQVVRYDFYGDRIVSYVSTYSPETAQRKYETAQTAKGRPLKIGKDFAFVRYMEKRVLQDKISPHAVIGEIKKRNLPYTHISKPTLYRYIEMGIFEHISIADLPYRKLRKGYRKVRASRPPRGMSIEARSQEIASRLTFGHWEMDCVCGPTLPTLLVLSERKTRKEIIMPMKNQCAKSVIHCLNVLERKYGKTFRQVFKTITVDNGSEFAYCKEMEKSCFGGKRTNVYYCHPYCSSERGTNERLNREIRRRFPKGTDFSKVSIDDVKEVEKWLNNYPRSIFDYDTSQNRFDEELRNLAI